MKNLLVVVLLSLLLTSGVAASQSVTPDISADSNKKIVEPVAHTPDVVEVHQAGYLNSNIADGEPMIVTVTIYGYDDKKFALSELDFICEDARLYWQDLNVDARKDFIGIGGNSEGCFVTSDNPSSMIIAIQNKQTVIVLQIAAISGDVRSWSNDMLESLFEQGDFSLGDPSWIPGGRWTVQTGPYNITATAQTALENRP